MPLSAVPLGGISEQASIIVDMSKQIQRFGDVSPAYPLRLADRGRHPAGKCAWATDKAASPVLDL